MRFEEEEDIPLISGTGEAFMDVPGTPAAGSRRDEDIALDLMKFIAMTTGYGKTTAGSGGGGFEKGRPGAAETQDYSAPPPGPHGKGRYRVNKKTSPPKRPSLSTLRRRAPPRRG